MIITKQNIYRKMPPCSGSPPRGGGWTAANYKLVADEKPRRVDWTLSPEKASHLGEGKSRLKTNKSPHITY